MADARRHTFASQCQGKVGFEPARLAHDINQRRGRRGKGRGQKREVYKCRWCSKWHLGRSD